MTAGQGGRIQRGKETGMGLLQTDQKPRGISLDDAYSAIRAWYIANVSKALARNDEYGRRSAALIRALPPSAPGNLETRAVLGEVIYGNLEWRYHESDGRYKMAAYAHSALETGGHPTGLSDDERQQLQSSPLARHFSWNRQGES